MSKQFDLVKKYYSDIVREVEEASRNYMHTASYDDFIETLTNVEESASVYFDVSSLEDVALCLNVLREYIEVNVLYEKLNNKKDIILVVNAIEKRLTSLKELTFLVHLLASMTDDTNVGKRESLELDIEY